MGQDEPGPGGGPARDREDRLESSVELLERARSGDQEALDRLFTRYMQPLRRWAAGRLPSWARDLLDTDDLVQETLIRVVRRVENFEPRQEGALQMYMRTALQNRVRDEIRRVQRHPPGGQLQETRPDPGPSPLEQTIGREALERYERALSSLTEEESEAIVARIELAMSYEDVARSLGKPSADAARMTVSRALVRLAEEMGYER